MEISQGLLDSMVLQRNRKNASEGRFSGACRAEGELLVRVTKAGRAVRGFSRRAAGRAVGGRFDGSLAGLPIGGPYLVELAIVDAAGTILERTKVPNVRVGDVWIAAGQSNMQGCGVVSKPRPKIDAVRAFYMDDIWRVARDPIHNLWDCVDPVHVDIAGGVRAVRPPVRHCGIGPAVSFAQEMFRRTKAPQGILACAHGGTSMAQWDPALKDRGGRSLYGATVRRVTKNGGKVAGVIWYQGESDASKDACGAYSEKMRDLIGALRRDAGDEGLPVAVVQISRVVSGDFDPAAWNSVQDHQRRLSEAVARVTTVPAIDLELDDLIHIGGKAQERLGQRLAQAMAALMKLPRAGKPPIERDRISVAPDKRTGLANVAVSFRNVMGALRAPGRPSGFALSDPRPVAGIFRTTLDGTRVLLETTMSIDQLEGKYLQYGIGLDPYCNITDSADRSLPALGRIPLGRGRAMTPFVHLWRRSEMLAAPADLASTGLPWATLRRAESASDFCDLHLEIERVREDRLIYLACRVECGEEMKLRACLGYDGPVKMWVDGREAFADPKGANPAIVDRARVPMPGTRGAHDVVVALHTNRGRAWGIYLRFERLDVSKELMENAPERVVLPAVVAIE